MDKKEYIKKLKDEILELNKTNDDLMKQMVINEKMISELLLKITEIKPYDE